MVNVQRSFTVPAPQHAVLDYLKDFAETEQWDPGTLSCQRLDAGPIIEGSTWRNVSEFRGKKTELTYTLLKLEIDRLVFEGRNKTATSEEDIRIQPDGAATTVTYTARITFHGIAKLADPFMKSTFEELADGVVTGITRQLT